MAARTNAINAAFETAVRDFKAALGDEKLFEAISKTKCIKDVYDATDALQKEQAASGRLRHLAKIQPYLEGLRSYASVIEVFVQTKQDVLSLIWGPIKLLLQWTNNMKQTFDAIVDALADIGLLLPEFQEVSKLLTHNEHIKDVLVFFFRDILDFYLIVLKFFRKTYLKLIFESMWPKQREKINIVRAQIQRHTLLLRREVGLEHIQEAHNAQLQALAHYEKTEKSFRRQEYTSLKISISHRAYEGTLDSFQPRVYQETGRWLLKDPLFIKWLDMSDASVKVLWLQGIPGAGKTFLSSIIVHRAIEVEQTRTIYAFLSYRFRDTSSAVSILHSLLFQLASGHDDLEDILCQASTEVQKRSVDATANLLRTLLGCAGPTYILIDGMDEIEETERSRFLKQVLEVSRACQEVKILISSRAEADIADLLKDQVSIRVDSRNAGSIHTFVKRRTEEWFDKCEFLPEARDEIQGLLAPLASKAKGMFLYAEVVLSSMDSLDDIGEIREELKVLPESLDAAYSRILDRINRLSAPLRDKVRNILGWVGCVPVPLMIQEIEQALVVSREGVQGNAKVISVLNMPRVCGPIVEVVDGYVQFVHFTVKEYFFSPSINGSLSFMEATLSLATCCITYLCQTHHDYNIPDADLEYNILSGAYRLHDFAVLMWPELLKRYNHLVGQGSVCDKLVDVLETLRCERANETYEESAGSSTPSYLERLKTTSPALHDIICKAVHFRELSLKSNFDKEKVPFVYIMGLTIYYVETRVMKVLVVTARSLDGTTVKDPSDAVS
ncbi:hypothetical protein LTR84_011895 [Exophiala bonariae]|uniref:NACHT domain-containing protein n=1 Tax=Exophiala bonariae TaxID=1690606 RepID=A0AAV9NKX7_9EURO|nr:hypothetical protein LTR84_011895 [Exophiala bonariae]